MCTERRVALRRCTGGSEIGAGASPPHQSRTGTPASLILKVVDPAAPWRPSLFLLCSSLLSFPLLVYSAPLFCSFLSSCTHLGRSLLRPQRNAVLQVLVSARACPLNSDYRSNLTVVSSATSTSELQSCIVVPLSYLTTEVRDVSLLEMQGHNSSLALPKAVV